MSKGRFKYWVVLVNLMALNAYALAAVHVEHRMQFQQSLPAAVSSAMHDCDMPCCHGQHASNHPTHSLSHCDCSTELCSAVQMQCIESFAQHLIPYVSDKVDAMSAVVPIQNPAQRFLKPPIP